MSKIYLATPYSHANPAIRQARFEAVTKAAGELIAQGHLVFSPITHGHPINQMCGTPTNYEYWREFNNSMIWWCDALWLLMLDGWESSEGMKREHDYADVVDDTSEHNIQIEYIDPVTLRPFKEADNENTAP